jgi:TonB-linked SusC/RagA family outer membrane protein
MNILKNNTAYIFISLCFALLSGGLHAQNVEIKIEGTVTNEYGQPVQEALILSENGKNQYLSGSDGTYSLTISDGSVSVVVSAKGYQNLRKSTADLLDDSNLRLTFDPHETGGYVNLGFFSQSRESVTGAVSTVTGETLNKAPVNVFSETLAGRLNGLTTIQNYTEFTDFGYANIAKYIRGVSTVNGTAPLILIDGVVSPSQYYEFLSPKEIESVTILKDGSTTAIYGIQGAGGVIVITTKRGFTGKKKIEFYADQSLQQMTKRPSFVNSAKYAELRNQAGINDGLGAFSQFSQEEIDGFRSGDRLYYPDNNWYDMFVKKVTYRQRAGINISGGSDKIKYFSNISYLHQDEPMKVADEKDRKYDPTPNVNQVNFRSNFDVKLNNYLSAFMRLTGNVKREMFAGTSINRSIYNTIFSLPPTMFGPLTPIFEDNPDISNQVVTTDVAGSPTYGLINRSGYSQIIETNVLTQSGLSLDMSFLTEGLSMNGSVAYQTYARNITSTSQNYERYVRNNDYTELEFTKKGAEENTPLVYGKGSTFFYYLNLFGNMDYNRRFGDHSIDAMAYINYLQRETESNEGSTILPYKRQNMGVSLSYGYLDKYFVKGDLGYSGSEQFHPDHRYMATPSIAAAWIVSKEDFFENVSAISLLKPRVSYGISGNDNLGGDRFLYLDYIDNNGNEGLKGNPELSAEKIKKQNYGIDLGLFKQFSVSFDYFIHKTDNMLVGSIAKIPVYQGVPLNNYPKLNNGKMENKGFEVEVGYNKQLSQDLSVFASLGFSQAKNKVISINESPYAEDYPYRYHTEGYSVLQNWGYLIDRSNGSGMYQSAEELAAYGLSYSFGSPRVGDFIYYDLNNDGTIDEKDMAPMGYSSIPQQNVNLSGGLQYKNWEFSFLFQGVNNISFFTSGIGAYENEAQGVFNDIHLNAWTPERYAAGEEISYPALSLTKSVNHTQNDFFLANASYLRLKNMEIAYSLPINASKKIASERIRISLNAQNLFTIDNMRSKYIDPETKNMSGFQPYRVYNIGLSLIF